MTSADEFDLVKQAGAAARSARVPYLSNPHLRSAETLDSAEALWSWHAKATAWASGWLRQDEGRDVHVAAMISYAIRTSTPGF
jgi:hypothetical protein